MKDFEVFKIENIDENPFVQSMMDDNMKPVKIYYAGDYEHEQVVIQVFHDCDLSDYLLIHIVRNEEDLPNYGRCHVLSFDDIELHEGDTVKVMTCRGRDHEENDADGHTIHVIYWNLPVSIWSEDENEVMIMERGNSVTSYLKNSSSKEN